MRYKGHYEKFKTMLDLGLLDTNPVKLGENEVSPRDLFHKVVAPKIDFPEDKDLVVLRTTCKGTKDGKNVELTYDIMDFHDDATGFTAMERTTAYPASIVAIMMAKGQTDKGSISLESAIDGAKFVDELKKRDIKLTETVRTEA
ncbi:MAG: saccharopine dehydrogenase C-terminal domain-containing protein [Candidatus Sericytochromatia bacterium]